MRRVGRSCLRFAAMLAALSGCGCSIVPSHEPSKPELIEPAKVNANFAAVQRGDLVEAMHGVGVVVPASTDYLVFETDGTLSERLAVQGDIVRKGDVLMRLDPGKDELQLLQQKLALEKALAALNESLESVDAGTIRIARLSVEIEKLKLERLTELRSKRVLKASADGIVTFIDDLKPGDPVAAYREIVGIARTDRLQISYIGDFRAFSSRIKIGMPVELQIGGKAAKGKIAAAPWTAPVDLYPERAAVLDKTLLLDFDGSPPTGIAIGDYIDFQIVLSSKPDVLIVPRGALRKYQGRTYVLAADENGNVQEVDVQPGLTTQTEVEIVSGLSEGQRVAVYQ
ncbi:efflux RND transporter periplasmic adaptor subunit [Paenibacillus thermotolerans]|uniref:efflux RND transporter periplasmic adaptor subunit n=1 Tax=Paenibacillus thermotolerans TaxID=3027807 RepID=UPI002368AAB5|nr:MULTISPECIES: efflux RND transporter periplasmic adaptor subunit [unclassified Paenibacillus]